MTILNFSSIKKTIDNRTESFIDLGEKYGFNEISTNESSSDFNVGSLSDLLLIGDIGFLNFILIPIILIVGVFYIIYGIFKLCHFINENRVNKKKNRISIKLMRKNKNYFSPLDKNEIKKVKSDIINKESLNYILLKYGYISNYSIDAYFMEFKPEKFIGRRKIVFEQFLKKGIINSVKKYINNNKEKLKNVKETQKSFI